MAWGDDYTSVGNYGQGSGTGTTPTAAGSGQGSGGAGWMGNAKSLFELWQAYKNSQDGKVKFEQPPLSPQQEEMWGLGIKAVKELPTAQMLGPMASSILQGYSGMSFKAPDSVDIPQYGIKGAAGYESKPANYTLGQPYWPTNGSTGGSATTPSGRPLPGMTGGGAGQITPQEDLPQGPFTNPNQSSFGREPFNRVSSDGADVGNQESIGGALFRDPGRSVSEGLPNGGAAAEGGFNYTDPNAPSLTDPQTLQRGRDWLSAHPGLTGQAARAGLAGVMPFGGLIYDLIVGAVRGVRGLRARGQQGGGE